MAHFRFNASGIEKLHENGLEVSDYDCLNWQIQDSQVAMLNHKSNNDFYKLHDATFLWGGLVVSTLHSICADLVQRELFISFFVFRFLSFFFFSWGWL